MRPSSIDRWARQKKKNWNPLFFKDIPPLKRCSTAVNMVMITSDDIVQP
jgi:hypothetical protein